LTRRNAKAEAARNDGGKGGGGEHASCHGCHDGKCRRPGSERNAGGAASPNRDSGQRSRVTPPLAQGKLLRQFRRISLPPERKEPRGISGHVSGVGQCHRALV
jgi:hypothetical protein